MLTVDASIAVHLALTGGRPAALRDEHLIAPPLLWSETTSAIHELGYRGEVGADVVATAIGRLRDLGIEQRAEPGLYLEATRIAQRLGWAKTYDAEYVALAVLSGTRLLTRDGRLQRGAGRIVRIIGPAEL